MDELTRRELIGRYRDGYGRSDAGAGWVHFDELDRRPAPDQWTAREIVHHLGDSEMTSAIRLRRLIAEDGRSIQGYDQEEYAHGCSTIAPSRPRWPPSRPRANRRRKFSIG